MKTPVQRTGLKNRKSSGYPRAGGRKDTLNEVENLIYGQHAVLAALQNANRKCRRLLATQNALNDLQKHVDFPENMEIRQVSPDHINKKLKPGTVHQGVLLTADPLPDAHLEEVAARGKPLIVLDQVTDPGNVGAIIRAAAVFDAGGIIMTRRNSPAPGGALAKTASGALEKMPLVRVANLARCLESLSGAGYLTCGLDEEGSEFLGDMPRDRPIACVMGAEGKGLRRLTKEHCERLARLTPASVRNMGSFATLNVAAAAAVALYELAR